MVAERLDAERVEQFVKVTSVKSDRHFFPVVTENVPASGFDNEMIYYFSDDRRDCHRSPDSCLGLDPTDERPFSNVIVRAFKI